MNSLLFEPPSKTFVTPTLSLFLLLCISPSGIKAGSASWNLHPASNDWNTPANWTQQPVAGGTARVELFGNGTLHMSYLAAPSGISIGSLEGDGIVSLGSNRPSLTMDTNNLSTVFSGVIQGSGSVVKSGSGTLTLTRANTYVGSTAIAGGFLKITNRSRPSLTKSLPVA